MTQSNHVPYGTLLLKVLDTVEQLASLPHIDIKLSIPQSRKKVFVAILSVKSMVILHEHVFTFDCERSRDWNHTLKERMLAYADKVNRELAE